MVTTDHRIGDTFITTGFRKWDHALDKQKGFTKHQDADCHKASYSNWLEHEKILDGSETSIIKKLIPDIEEVAIDNREYFNLIFKYICWFISNELPMRAHREDEDSVNQGNWLSFIKLQLQTNSNFNELHQKMLSKRLVTDYTSKTVVNEIISTMAEECRIFIYNQIKKSGIFSILIDESKDKAKREELAFLVRYTVNGCIEERFLNLVTLQKFDAHSIMEKTKALIDIVQNNSDQACLISFGADGASVMSGEYAGVAQLLKSHFNWLIYTHCTAHRLNLVVNDLIKTSILATDVMSLINSLYNFLNIAKVQIEYEKNYKEANPKSQVKNITQQIEIRWACKFEGIDFVLKNINVIHMVLIKIMNAEKGSFKSKHVETALGIYHKLLCGKFVVSMVTLHNYLKELYYLNKELQAEKINWTNVNFEILRTRQAINLISDDLILKTSQEICDHLEINLSLTVPLSVHNTRSTAIQTDATNYVKETVNIPYSQLKEK